MEKHGITPDTFSKYIPMINMVKPNAAAGILGMLEVLKNPELLNQALHETVDKLTEVLFNDDKFLHTVSDQSGKAEESGRVDISTTGVRGGQEGDREKYTSGDSDAGVSTELQPSENTSENTHHRYETAIQSGEGTEWDTDWMES